MFKVKVGFGIKSQAHFQKDSCTYCAQSYGSDFITANITVVYATLREFWAHASHWFLDKVSI